MRVIFDDQACKMQKFGGVSRYFSELSNNSKYYSKRVDSYTFFQRNFHQKRNLISRTSTFIANRLISRNEHLITNQLTKYFSNHHFDIFHPTYYDPYFLGIIKKPIVVTVHDMIHEIYKEYFPLSDKTTINKLLLTKAADKIITVSLNTKADLMEILKIPEEKIEAIHLASDFDKIIAHKPSEIGMLKNYILYVGTRGGYKNFYYPVMALAELLKADKNLQILCTGLEFSGPELIFFSELGIKDQVKQIYLRNDHELAWIYQNAALFIFPSLYEGFGFPLLEAFASNCPVVSSTGGSLPEVAGDAALFFDPKNRSQIIETTAKVLYNPEVNRSLVGKGQMQFKKFSWDRCRDATYQVYKTILN